jgi:vitamin B12 transporter
VQQLSEVAIKLRGSYGRAIRAPGFGFKLAASSPVGIVLANPSLAPERQQGWDAGVDAAFGSRVSLGLTYYDQTADNLIQYVLLQAGPPATYQYRNVGRVVNTGIEVEASLDLGPVLLKGQYGYARSRIAQLAASYSGDLAVGDQSRDTPKHTAGATLTAGLFKGTTLTGGLTYVGSWNDYDYLAEFRCFGGTGPCRATLRDYVMAYPGFVKLNATLFQQLTRELSGFISVDNLTDNNAFELYNRNAVMGRISTVGFRFQR